MGRKYPGFPCTEAYPLPLNIHDLIDIIIRKKEKTVWLCRCEKGIQLTRMGEYFKIQ